MSATHRTAADLARVIDHTLLKPEATAGQIDRLCAEGLEFGFASVCVNPVWVARCVAAIQGGSLHSAIGTNSAQSSALHHAGHAPVVCSVAGFPLGATSSAAKALETRLAVEQGAAEVDMVVNLGALIDGDEVAAQGDVEAVVAAARAAGKRAIVKVILETAALTEPQIIAGCRCATRAGADFVKTSTGFHPAGGATVAHVALLRRHAGGMKVKASGGIRDLAAALAMLDAGADRLGMSAGVTVVQALAAGRHAADDAPRISGSAAASLRPGSGGSVEPTS